MRLLMKVRGYGLSADAHHVTQPAPDGRGAILAMQRAFHGSGVPKSALAYINAHATSTPLGDAIEAVSIARMFDLPGCGAAGKVLSSLSMSAGVLTGKLLLGIRSMLCILVLSMTALPPLAIKDRRDVLDSEQCT
jgi:3-oxoacyl-[acyl-carrier-protein] synthase II